MSSAALLATPESTLRRIEALTSVGKRAWDADEIQRLAIERPWIAAGDLAEAHREAAELPPGGEPWAEPAQPGTRNPKRVPLGPDLTSPY